MVVALVLAGLAARPVHAAADSEQGGPGRGGDGVPPGLAVTTQMRIEGLNGNNPTPVVSFSLGAANTGSTSSGGGGGAGKATFSPLTVSKGLDADSVPLLQAAATGQVLRTVTIEVFNAGTRVPFATYTFEDVLVSSSVIGASGSVDEQDTFDFRRITSDVTVNGQAFHSCFDIKANASCS
jgi:type VI secretion system secreted protein Hcp